ncbi:MAG: zinc-ribbon domain-containing protein [Bradyrhizobium sp.]|uniref:MJ0042-type zinc finger domain-containing protein n=1 Tax=Bradyrhizobium sp. TaxID=376 RepID=UPI001DC55DC0|nr:MJ0042-type zinc finger domain-containing protein [Bradyrhizobium sp.]MBV9565998.1 zinc-ribbon domain-containing protein [Bradyrhizobium sp.]
MHIVCPHCTTSYAIDMATLGPGGRTVRCSRCKEVWLARPEDAIEAVAAPAMAGATPRLAGQADSAAEWEAMARAEADDPPIVDSPPIAGDWQDEASDAADWQALARDDAETASEVRQKSGRFGRIFNRPPRNRAAGRPLINLPTASAPMAALVLALIIWRADVVRLMPQTAAFYKLAGLEVNLRGVLFKDVRVTSETVEGKPVLVIEGVIVGEARKAVELPRLRFAVRDAQGTEIYAWNAVLEQTVLKPGERAFFKSRLASPPAEGRSIDVRFFNRRDIAGGSA